ncbi:hypothetical protein D3C87_1055040 [compost metagenome]
MQHDSFRLFLCHHCRAQVAICACCDRGQAYCSDTCRRLSRKTQMRRAAARYQASPRGALRHAARQAEYRRRKQEKVTHHGSPQPAPEGNLVTVTPPEGLTSSPPALRPHPSATVQCHFCGHPCRPYARQDFIRWRTGRRTPRPGASIP